MLKQALQLTKVPSIKWFDFVTGLSEPQFLKRRPEVILLHHDQSSNALHGIDLGPSLEIRFVNIHVI
jgi:hypothetical protein